MKLALLGDVHGNHLALAAVLQAARARGAERLLITGDLVGYYFWPAEVMQLLEPWEKHAVRGNHEDMFIQAQARPESLAGIERKYGSGLRVALDALSLPQRDWLNALPHPLDLAIEGRRILLCHGAPWNVDQYVYPDADEALIARCAEGAHDWVVLGHTHYPMQRRHGASLVVNPGSAGQPRDRRPGAHWAFLDTSTGRIDHYCESYDIGWVVAQSRALEPRLPYLWDVLDRT